METIEIRSVALNDIEQLQQIGRQTFYETFSAGNTEENMTNYLNEGFSIEKLEAELGDKNADYVWLGVWEENPRAINFYKKNGFVEFDKHIFKLGDDEQTDIMMKVALN